MIILVMMTSFVGMVAYIINFESLTKDKLDNKNIYVSIVGLPDLAISTEAGYIRHRSLSDIKSIFADGPEHLEYFPSTFAMSYKEQRDD